MAPNSGRKSHPSLAKPRTPSRQTLEFYTFNFNSINLSIKVGDDIMLRAPRGKGPYVAKVVEIIEDSRCRMNKVKIRARWYYRPKDMRVGLRNFFGSARELFLSDHVDTHVPQSIEGKCMVHSFENYMKLDEIQDTDYFCRLEYDPNTQRFNPDRIEVFCSCELAWNPDLMMIKCDECCDWFHPECQNFTREEAENVEKFFCSTCQVEVNATIQRQISNLKQEHVDKKPRIDSSLQYPAKYLR